VRLLDLRDEMLLCPQLCEVLAPPKTGEVLEFPVEPPASFVLDLNSDISFDR
jgi:hypothetical protein